MRIDVQAKPKSRTEYIKKTGEHSYTVAVRNLPEKGSANSAIQKALAVHFGIAPGRVVLLRGKSSKRKIFDILLPF